MKQKYSKNQFSVELVTALKEVNNT